MGNVPWHSFSVSFNGDLADNDETPWKCKEYNVWFCDPRMLVHNQLGNMDFAKEMDYAPKEICNKNDVRMYTDFISGNWAWRQAVCLSCELREVALMKALFSRTRLQRTLTHTTPHSVQLSSAATRPLSLSVRDTESTTQFISRMG